MEYKKEDLEEFDIKPVVVTKVEKAPITFDIDKVIPYEQCGILFLKPGYYKELIIYDGDYKITVQILRTKSVLDKKNE